jgi:hypothetical protein
MLAPKIRARFTITVAGVCGLAAASLGTAGAAAGVTAAAGGPGHWSRVTPLGTATVDDIGLVRGSDGVLHAVWASDHPGSQNVEDTPITSNGTVNKPVTIAHFYLATSPDAAVTTAGLDVLWNGIKTSTGPSGTFVATRPASGGSWAVTGTVPPLPGIPYTSSSDTATTGSDGKPWVAFTGTDSLAVDHLGHPEVELGPAQCCVYEAGLATDDSSGRTWVSYLSLITGHQGIFVRPLTNSGTAAGAAKLLPGSAAGGHVVILNQRVAITSRGKNRAGVYVAYLHGYPTAQAFDLARLGPGGSVKVTTFGGLNTTLTAATVTADPTGRLWLAWFHGHSPAPALFVRRSNQTATAFGKVQRIPLPAGSTDLWKVYLNAQSGRLDVLALLTTKDNKSAYWSTQVVPAG